MEPEVKKVLIVDDSKPLVDFEGLPQPTPEIDVSQLTPLQQAAIEEKFNQVMKQAGPPTSAPELQKFEFSLQRIGQHRLPHQWSRVTLYGDPILQQAAREVVVGDLELIEGVFYPMVGRCAFGRPAGAGLAGPQVGMGLRFFVLMDAVAPHIVVNPTIEVLDPTLVTEQEGCLSIPGLLVDVPRPSKIKATWMDTNGETLTADLEGFNARVFQHEYDHLQGKLITDYIPTVDLPKYVDLLKNLTKQSKRARENQKSI